MSILLFLERSTPAILATFLTPPYIGLGGPWHAVPPVKTHKSYKQGLTLTLLVLGVLADHAHNTAALDNLALRTNPLYRASYLHNTLFSVMMGPVLLGPVCYPAAGKVVRRKLHRYLVPWEDLNKMHPHLAGDMSQHHVLVLQLDLEHGVGQCL